MIVQTPWIERKFNFGFPAGLFPVIVERLRGTIPHLRDAVAQCPEEILNHKPEGSWSIKEHVGHLNDLEELWFGRIRDFLAGNKTLRAADMSNAKTHGAGHNEKSIGALIISFEKSRNELISAVEDLDPDKVEITAVHPRLQQAMRLVDLLYFISEHDDHHLATIRRLSQQ